MAKIDQNGVPSVVAAETTESGQTIGAAVLETTTPVKTFGGLASDLLEQFDNEAAVIIDPNTRSIFGASGAAGAGMVAAALGVADVEIGEITPDAGQTGKSLAYTKTNIVDLNEANQAAIGVAIDAAKPKRTLQSLVSAILGADALDGEEVLPVIVVDQANGKVQIIEPTTEAPDAVTTALDALADAGDRVKLKLTGGFTDTPSTKLVFEGGSTGA